jgi:hypothetical protein
MLDFIIRKAGECGRVQGIGSLPKTSIRFAPDVIVNLPLGERGAK